MVREGAGEAAEEGDGLVRELGREEVELAARGVDGRQEAALAEPEARGACGEAGARAREVVPAAARVARDDARVVARVGACAAEARVRVRAGVRAARAAPRHVCVR